MAHRTVPPIEVSLEPDGCWPDLNGAEVQQGDLSHLALTPDGTISGMPTVTLRITLRDGSTVIAVTSLALLDTARAAIRGKLGR